MRRKLGFRTLREAVKGLRDEGTPSDVRVYSAATGKLIRTEPAAQYNARFNRKVCSNT